MVVIKFFLVFSGHKLYEYIMCISETHYEYILPSHVRNTCRKNDSEIIFILNVYILRVLLRISFIVELLLSLVTFAKL